MRAAFEYKLPLGECCAVREHNGAGCRHPVGVVVEGHVLQTRQSTSHTVVSKVVNEPGSREQLWKRKWVPSVRI